MLIQKLAIAIGSFIVASLLIACIVRSPCKSTSNSIILKNFENKLDLLKRRVRKLAVARSSITISPTDAFTDGFCSHWALLVYADDNMKFLISPSDDKSVIVHRLSNKTFKHINSTHDSFINCNGYTYTFNPKCLYKITHKTVTLSQLINDMYRVVSEKDYTILSNNCHRHVAIVANPYLKPKYKIQYIDNPFKLFVVGICEILDPTLPFFHSCR